MRSIALLGATGSIGHSTLDVVASFPDEFRIVALAAGRKLEPLAEAVRRFRPEIVSVEREEDVPALRSLLSGWRGEIVWGGAGLDACATWSGADTVVGGLVGAVGLSSAHAALVAGKRLALANKETMVVAGEMMARAASASGAEILPVDSEHSAIHQALRAGAPAEVERLVLTGSGGPFRSRDLSTFDSITIEDALAHPTWKMGPKITIDSATMMNKGLEIIEAHFLFGVPAARIGVLVHPQSLVHSMVEFRDGSIVAQMAVNDMRFPILYALAYPERPRAPFGRLDLAGARLEFAEIDPRRYPAVALAREALEEKGAAPAILNAANEVAVEAFLAGKIPFLRIVPVVVETRAAMGSRRAPASVAEAAEIDAEARRIARERAARAEARA
ncbi:MAG TPA: 1-deoxy-D-xylulose-5-phosphate reductoisomerase [Thermoanaerobaculia bacterium]|nr:1-deoxy-D-xylulose-5-phosphate reductoisomerase [Thermoanaerobaculia bacterium]